MPAWTLWLLGYPDQALRGSHEALRPGPGAGAPLQPGVCPVLCGLSPSVPPGVRTLAQEQAEAAMTLATEQGFPHWVAGARSSRAGRWPAAGPGREEGMAQIRQGLTAWRATGAR